MLTYKIYQTLDLIIGILLFPIQIVLNLVLNILSNLGIFFMPILLCLNLIYLFLLGIILACSWLHTNIPFLGAFASIIGIPAAILATFIVSATPALDGLEDRFNKLLIINFYPFSLDWFLLTLGKKDVSQEIEYIFNQMNNLALKSLAAKYIFKTPNS